MTSSSVLKGRRISVLPDVATAVAVAIDSGSRRNAESALNHSMASLAKPRPVVAVV